MVLTVPADMLKSEHHLRSYEYDFEQIYDQTASQDDLFRELSTLIQSSVDGYAVCVFAYGQTGAGKTYTMIGGEGPEMGLLPRTVDLIFERFKALEGAGIKCSIDISFVEIYNEKMRDLVEHTGKEIKDLTLTSVKSKEQLVERIYLARQKRFTAKTCSNEVSSRSHAIFHIRITCLHTEKKKPKTTIGSVTIVDLAGSERLKESKTIGDRFQETRAINSSLSSLKDVISALSKKESYVPYRNSLLTQVLEPYLGKESKTLVIINVSPFSQHCSQTNGSLQFGKQLRNCTNKVAERRPQALSILSSGKKNNIDRLNSSFSSVSNHTGPLARMGSGMKIANRGHEAAMKKSLSGSVLSESIQPESRAAANSKSERPIFAAGAHKFPSFLKPTASSSSKGSASLGTFKPSTTIVDENSNTSNFRVPDESTSFRPAFSKPAPQTLNESLLLSPIEESPAHNSPFALNSKHKIVPEGSLLSGIEEVDERYASASHRKSIQATPRFGLDIEYSSPVRHSPAPHTTPHYKSPDPHHRQSN